MNRDNANTQEPEQAGVLPLFSRCTGCPYSSHGFICWSRDGSCMLTWMYSMMEKWKGGTQNGTDGNTSER